MLVLLLFCFCCVAVCVTLVKNYFLETPFVVRAGQKIICQ